MVTSHNCYVSQQKDPVMCKRNISLSSRPRATPEHIILVHVLFSFAGISWPYGSACKETELSTIAKYMCQTKTKTDFFKACCFNDSKTSGQCVCQLSEHHADREIIKMHVNMYESYVPVFTPSSGTFQPTNIHIIHP